MPRTYATLGGRSSRDYANAPSAQIPDSYIDGDSHLEGVSLARDNGSYRANPAQHLVREIPQGLPPTNLARVAAAPPLIIVRIVRPSKSLARKASEVGPERQAQQSLRCESEGFSESLSRPSQSRAPSPRGGAEAESETRRWIPESAGVPEPRSVYPWLSRGPFNQAEIARIRAEEAARRRSGLSIYAYMMERARSFYTFSSAPGPTTAGLDQATAQASATGTDDDVTKLSPMLYTRESPDSDSEDGVDAAVEPVDGRNIRPVSPFWRDGPTGSEMDSLGSTPSSPIVAGDQTFASIYEALQRVPAPLRPTPATPPTPTPAGSRPQAAAGGSGQTTNGRGLEPRPMLGPCSADGPTSQPRRQSPTILEGLSLYPRPSNARQVAQTVAHTTTPAVRAPSDHASPVNLPPPSLIAPPVALIPGPPPGFENVPRRIPVPAAAPNPGLDGLAARRRAIQLYRTAVADYSRFMASRGRRLATDVSAFDPADTNTVLSGRQLALLVAHRAAVSRAWGETVPARSGDEGDVSGDGAEDAEGVSDHDADDGYEVSDDDDEEDEEMMDEALDRIGMSNPPRRHAVALLGRELYDLVRPRPRRAAQRTTTSLTGERRSIELSDTPEPDPDPDSDSDSGTSTSSPQVEVTRPPGPRPRSAASARDPIADRRAHASTEPEQASFWVDEVYFQPSYFGPLVPRHRDGRGGDRGRGSHSRGDPGERG